MPRTIEIPGRMGLLCFIAKYPSFKWNEHKTVDNAQKGTTEHPYRDDEDENVNMVERGSSFP
jgi:hypothetical protein